MDTLNKITKQAESFSLAIDSLKLYQDHKIPTGSFLEAVLSNDLMGAMRRADEYSKMNLYNIVYYIYNEMPSNCWGSGEIVSKWLSDK